MGFLVCAAMMGDSSSVTAAGCHWPKKRPEAVTETFSQGPRCYLKWEPPSGEVSEVRTIGEVESSQIHSSRVGVILYIIAM